MNRNPEVEDADAGQDWSAAGADADRGRDESPIQLRRELRRRVGNPRAATGSHTHDPAVGGAVYRARPVGSDRSDGTADSSPDRRSEAEPAARTPPGSTGPGGPGGVTGTHPRGGGGRHARRDGEPRPPRLDYMPRHAIRATGPYPLSSASSSSVSPTEVTELLARVRQDPTERPRPDRPEPEPIHPVQAGGAAEVPPAPSDPEPEVEEAASAGKRVRVVLSQRKGQTRPVRTVVDVQELTQVGQVLSTNLIRSQLALALRIGGIALLVLGSLPAMFVIFPMLGRFELFGLRLPWLLLGVLAYPFLFGLGWLYARAAERLEQVFADHIQS